jgi:hypothetical protein
LVAVVVFVPEVGSRLPRSADENAVAAHAERVIIAKHRFAPGGGP